MSVRYQFRLYLAGPQPLLMTNIQTTLSLHFADNYTLETIDVVKNPLLARADAIVVTPTLLRIQPAPIVKLTGDLCSQLLAEMLG